MPDLSKRNRFVYGCFQCLDKLIGRNIGHKITLGLRRKLYRNIERELKAKGKGTIQEVDRVQNISLNDFKRLYVDQNKPVVIEGGALSWACCQEWSLDYFSELHGDDDITIVAVDHTEKPYEIIKLKEVIRNIRSGGGKYFRFYPLLKEHPEHIKDFDYKWLRKIKSKISFREQFQVFIGGKGSQTPMHNAMLGNIFIQAYGEKEWILYKPEYTAIIDPPPGRNLHRSAPFKKSEGAFNPFEPDFESPYNLYQYIDGIRVRLQQGDIFFNPPHYWHAVQNPSDSIGIGYRWGSPIHAFKSAPLYTLLDFLTAPFNKNLYLKNDYNVIHLMEMGVYDAYKKEIANN